MDAKPDFIIPTLLPVRRVKVHFDRNVLACLNDHVDISKHRTTSLNMIPKHKLLGVRMQIHLLVHPLGHRMAVEVMLEPVRSYVSGTISGTIPCR